MADAAGLDRDAYDPTGVTLVARRFGDGDDRIVGSVRITDAVDGLFLIERHGLRLPGWLPRRTCRDVSRWAVTPIRGAATSLWLALGAAVWMRDEGLTHGLCVLTKQSHRALSRSPLPLFPLARPQRVVAYGRESVLHPVWIPVPRDVPEAPPWLDLEL